MIVSVNGITPEAKKALRERNIPFKKTTRHTHHSYQEWWDITFPEDTIVGGNGFQREDIPPSYDPYYKEGPKLPRTIQFFKLLNEDIFVYELGKDLDLYRGKLPSYEVDGNYKLWEKANPFAEWKIIGNSPYAQSFLERWKSNPNLQMQPYAQNAYNHIMQEDPLVHVEMVLH